MRRSQVGSSGPLRELHATGDKSVLEFDIDADPWSDPRLYRGDRSISGIQTQELPTRMQGPRFLRPHLDKKLDGAVRNSRSAYYGMKFA